MAMATSISKVQLNTRQHRTLVFFGEDRPEPASKIMLYKVKFGVGIMFISLYSYDCKRKHDG